MSLLSSNFKPREWQVEALSAWLENLAGIVSVVTGGGKTLFALMCIEKFKERFPEKKIIILVPTLTLLDQWYVTLLDDFNIPQSSVACFSSEDKSDRLLDYNLVLLNTARKLLLTIKSKKEYFLIVDECHRVGSQENSKAIKGDFSATLGLSATPEREYDDGFLRHIVPNLGKVIFDYDYLQALRDKVICQFEIQNVQVKMLPHEQQNFDKLSKKIRQAAAQKKKTETSHESIKRLLIQRAKVSASAMMRVPVTAKLVESHSAERIIVFHESIEGANEITRILKERKHAVSAYHSGISTVIRRDNLRLYKKGIYNILVTCKALDEGMNVPETTVAIIASSTASTRQRIQRLGRVLRPAKGKKSALIVTLFASENEQERLIDEFKRFKEDIPVIWMKSE